MIDTKSPDSPTSHSSQAPENNRIDRSPSPRLDLIENLPVTVVDSSPNPGTLHSLPSTILATWKMLNRHLSPRFKPLSRGKQTDQAAQPMLSTLGLVLVPFTQ